MWFDSGQFYGLEQTMINSKGNIVVSDSENCRMQIFSPKGEYLFEFGSQKYKNKDIYVVTPILVGINKHDDIIVQDRAMDKIYIFDSTGKFLFELDIPSMLDGKPFAPGMVAANDNFIVVKNEHDDRVRVFSF
ncbi:Hypothetical protein HVR_LOCUS708 [uncultured virus]|nr:Hypothetical protein HVR_LOCUS708 [uncultured virus]